MPENFLATVLPPGLQTEQVVGVIVIRAQLEPGDRKMQVWFWLLFSRESPRTKRVLILDSLVGIQCVFLHVA